MTDYHIFHIDYPHLSSKQWATLTHARSEAAKLWNRMVKLYKWGVKRRRYFTEARFKAHFKRRFALSAQTIQAIIEKFFAARRATQTKRQRGEKTARYPAKWHKYFNVTFKSQDIRIADGRLVLTLGRHLEPLSLPLPKNQDGLTYPLVKVELCREKLVVTTKTELPATENQGSAVVGVDLGVIHTAVCTNGEESLGVVGRGFRALKQWQAKTEAVLATKLARKTKYSRRYRRLSVKRRKLHHRVQHQTRDFLHKAATQVVKFCQDVGAKVCVVGNLSQITQHQSGKRSKRTNQQNWLANFGKLTEYLRQKLCRVSIKMAVIDEFYTSQTCPVCGRRHQPRGRVYRCHSCGFIGIRDEVGAFNLRNRYLHHGRIQAGDSIPTGLIKYLRVFRSSALPRGQRRTIHTPLVGLA